MGIIALALTQTPFLFRFVQDLSLSHLEGRLNQANPGFI